MQNFSVFCSQQYHSHLTNVPKSSICLPCNAGGVNSCSNIFYVFHPFTADTFSDTYCVHTVAPGVSSWHHRCTIGGIALVVDINDSYYNYIHPIYVNRHQLHNVNSCVSLLNKFMAIKICSPYFLRYLSLTPSTLHNNSVPSVYVEWHALELEL